MEMLDDEICRLYERLEKIEERLEIALEKINRKIDEKFELLIKMLTQDRS
jgi:tetrahydromethanopterin S-methyltransferase subunit G